MLHVNPKDSAIFAAVEKLREISAQWAEATRAESEAKKTLAEMEVRKRSLHESYAKLLDMAKLFDFSLKAEFEKMQAQQKIAPAATNSDAASIATPMPSDKRKTVKEYAIGAAQQAYPNPIRATALRAVLEDIGLKVHEKTVGMTLYRLSCDGILRRQGWDWFFVPETERPSRTQEQEEERSGDDPDLSLELTQ